jgi:hypothetical protein
VSLAREERQVSRLRRGLASAGTAAG